jgi:hypothetical protein
LGLQPLTENSWGDGRNRRTVDHILLLEPLQVGRLKRRERDFLCSSSAARNGKRWSGQVIDRAIDGYGNEYPPAVTCQTCLRLAERLLPGVATAARPPSPRREKTTFFSLHNPPLA